MNTKFIWGYCPECYPIPPVEPPVNTSKNFLLSKYAKFSKFEAQAGGIRLVTRLIGDNFKILNIECHPNP